MIDYATEPPRALCVESKSRLLAVMSRDLRLLGYSAVLTDSGAQALDLLKRFGFHIVICNQALPDVSGTNILTEAGVISPTTARILITDDQVDQDSPFASLSTPWNSNTLKDALTQALDARLDRWTCRSRIPAENGVRL